MYFPGPPGGSPLRLSPGRFIPTMLHIVGISDYSEFVNPNGPRIYLSPIY
jgi:hypothetical protein